jgi:putative (di)nucleoside polyphosphate hydrolase
MIRKAVGAIITQGDEILLVHKVKMMDGKKGPEQTQGQWDFPKGGVLPSDENLSNALLRELREETGSTQYRIIKQFEKKICFEFPKLLKEKLGFDEL